MRQQIKQYGKEALDAIYAGDEVWTKAMEEFNMVSIEASSFVLELSAVDEKRLAKSFYLSRGNLGKWAKPNKRDDAKELEDNTREVVRFMVEELNEMFGVEERKLSFMERLAIYKAQSSAKNSL